ncbi:MAG TPA: ArsB/NhaD family transporter [Actinomycetota bacterium]|jgi:Na+/H+ antiporter NhaD/arsenite permease-like protein
MRDAVVVSIFVLAYTLIATEWVHRVIVALAGAGLMLLFRFVSAQDAFQSERFGIDWNVIFLLFGMMVIVGVLRHTGLFEYIAIRSAKRARGRPFRIMVMLVLITAVASALLDNVTTVLLVAPVTLLIAERLGLSPIPMLISEAMASNIGGTATLIGDPPNILIGSQGGLSYIDFLVNLAPLVVVLMVVYILAIKLMFRRSFVYKPERVVELMALDERESLRERPLMVRALVILGMVTAAFVLHGVLHYEPSVVALLGAGVLLLVAGREPWPFLREVEWHTLVFFAGLFVMVGALVKAGVVSSLARAAIRATNGDVLIAVLLLVWVSAILSALVDNIPYVATMAPLVHELVRALPGSASTTVLWWALALGADLGGNATAIGASANVVILGIAARGGHRIRFLEFARYGVVVTLLTVGLSSIYLWIRYFVLA